MAFTPTQQAAFLDKIRRYRQLHPQHLRMEKEDEALHKSILADMGDQTRLELPDDEGSMYIITITTQERHRVNPTLLLAHYPTIYDQVLCLSSARMLHIEIAAQDEAV